MSPPRSVAVIGVSNDLREYGNKAVRANRDTGWQVCPVHPTEATAESLPAYYPVNTIPAPLEVASLYVPQAIGVARLPAIAVRKPPGVWINPGAESDELLLAGDKSGLNVVQACSIRAVGKSPANYPHLSFA